MIEGCPLASGKSGWVCFEWKEVVKLQPVEFALPHPTQTSLFHTCGHAYVGGTCQWHFAQAGN